MKYIIKVPEVHYNIYEVEANSPELAKEITENQIAEGVGSFDLEYSHTLEQEKWVVEESD
jgi:hypothetical protein